jgi:hypothetical protein
MSGLRWPVCFTSDQVVGGDKGRSMCVGFESRVRRLTDLGRSELGAPAGDRGLIASDA